MKSKSFIVLFILSGLFLVQSAGDSFHKEEADIQLGMKIQNQNERDGMLQFTTGEHVLGFRGEEMFIASNDHALRVEFINAKPVLPVEDLAGLELSRLKNRSGQNPFVFFNPETGKPFLDMKTSFKGCQSYFFKRDKTLPIRTAKSTTAYPFLQVSFTANSIAICELKEKGIITKKVGFVKNKRNPSEPKLEVHVPETEEPSVCFPTGRSFDIKNYTFPSLPSRDI